MDISVLKAGDRVCVTVYGGEDTPPEGRLEYLHLTQVTDNRIYGIDIQTLEDRGYHLDDLKNVMFEFSLPSTVKHNKDVGVACVREIRVLTDQEVEDVVEKRQLQLDQESRDAMKCAIKYRETTRKIFKVRSSSLFGMLAL